MSHQHHTKAEASSFPEARILESLTRPVRYEATLPWQIVGFIAALLLITITSHLLGGAAGRWADQQDSGNVATRPKS